MSSTADTKVLPAGIGSAVVTPVAVSGPLFVRTIVQVTVPAPSFCEGLRSASRHDEIDERNNYALLGGTRGFRSLLFESPEYSTCQYNMPR